MDLFGGITKATHNPQIRLNNVQIQNILVMIGRPRNTKLKPEMPIWNFNTKSIWYLVVDNSGFVKALVGFLRIITVFLWDKRSVFIYKQEDCIHKYKEIYNKRDELSLTVTKKLQGTTPSYNQIRYKNIFELLIVWHLPRNPKFNLIPHRL